MLLGHSGAGSRDGFFDAGLVGRDDVHVAFNDDDIVVATDSFFGVVKAKDETRFVEQNSFGGVQIFRLRFIKDASSETDNIAGGVNKWHHHAISEKVGFVLIEKAGRV